jgi:uncharacterized protein YcbX
VRVTAIHLHPIKGCRRVEVDRAVASPYGLAGDREWQVVHEVVPEGQRAFLTQRLHPQLTRVRPGITDTGIVLRAERMPDLSVDRPLSADTTTAHYSGESLVGDGGDAAAAWLTEVVGARVRLVGIAPGYERDAFGLFRTHAAFGDLAPILVANDASHRFLAERAVEPFGAERWRANLWVDGDEPWAEDTWRALRIGDATVALVLPWPRCAVPQVDQDDGTRHLEPALVLKQHRWCTWVPEGVHPIAAAMLPGNGLFGMSGAIEPAGASIAVGDEVVVVETAPALL